MAAIFQTTFWNAFSWMKMLEFRLKFHWSLFLRVQLTIIQHWFRYWLGASQATSHCLKQCWLVYWRIYASPGLNELKQEKNQTKNDDKGKIVIVAGSEHLVKAQGIQKWICRYHECHIFQRMEVNSLCPGELWHHRTFFNLGSGNDLTPNSTKPLPEAMLISHQCSPVAFTWRQFYSQNV